MPSAPPRLATRTGAKRLLKGCFSVIALASLMAWAAPGALAVNYSYPATYTGSTAVGGKVEFDTSSDGSSVIRFAISDVPNPCGIGTSTTTGSIPIVNEAFSYMSSGTSFDGVFPAAQQAHGTLTLQTAFPFKCIGEPVVWTATTPTPPHDTTPPQTTIKSGPPARTKSHKATFKFKSTEAGSTFECKLDKKPWKGCISPKGYKNLAHGKHVFKVRARDGAGNVDPTPAKRSWRVVS